MIRPKLAACGWIQRENIVVAGGNEHLTVDYDRRHFHGHVRVADARMEYPCWFEVGNVGRVDLIDVLESLIGKSVSVVCPVKISLGAAWVNVSCAIKQR